MRLLGDDWLIGTTEAAVVANDKAAAKAALDQVCEKWLRIETAVSRESPTQYRVLESAMNAVKNEAVRAKVPDPAKVAAANAALAKSIETVLPTLKQE